MMRYAIYWLPEHSDELYQLAHEWFNQEGLFARIIQEHQSELSILDFTIAFNIPKKYGFHAEILPPFTLKPEFSESDIFEVCRKIAKSMTRSDLKFSLTSTTSCQILKSEYKSNLVIKLKEELSSGLSSFINKPDFQIAKDFYITLSHSTNKEVQKNLDRISKYFWTNIIKNNIQINHFNLCYQKEKNANFQELMRFNFRVL